MATVDPDDIPTSVTKLVYTCPLSISKAVSQNQVAALLAHYWPAIEEHIRGQVAQEILDSPGYVVDGAAGWDSGSDREYAARVARGGTA